MTDATHSKARTATLVKAYRDIFTTMNSRSVLGDTPMDQMVIKLMDTNEEFVHQLAGLVADLPGTDHQVVFGLVGSMLRSPNISAREFMTCTQPFIDHYRRLFADRSPHFESQNWGRMVAYMAFALDDYSETVKDTLTTERTGRLLDATASILHAGTVQPASRHVMSYHVVPSVMLVDLILDYPDKAATINQMLRAGDFDAIEISAVVTGQTILPLLDGLL